MLAAAATLVLASYPGNFALSFDPSRGDIVRVPHESSMQGPLIDSFTVELWLLAMQNCMCGTLYDQCKLCLFRLNEVVPTLDWSGRAMGMMRYGGKRHVKSAAQRTAVILWSSRRADG